MILDLVCISKDFYTSNQIRFRFMYLLSNLCATNLYTKDFYYLVNILIDKVNVCSKEKF